MNQECTVSIGSPHHDNVSPVSGSDEERNRYHALQLSFAHEYEDIFLNILAEKTIVIIPSLSVDQKFFQKSKARYFMKSAYCVC